MSSKIKFAKLGVDLRARGQKDGPLSVDDMKKLLGWEEEPEGKDWGSDFLFKDLNKKKIRLRTTSQTAPSE